MQTPDYVWVIIRKNKTNIYFDKNDIQAITDAINANDFVYMSMYQCSIHKFDVDEIKIVKFTTPIAKEIEYELWKITDTTKKSLSFNDYVLWLQKKQIWLN